MSPSRSIIAIALVCCCGCRQDMHDQPRYEPYSASSFFPDGRSARPVVPGTIIYGQLHENPAYYEGLQSGAFATTIPVSATRDLLRRGEQRYDIYCSPCHGLTGDGDGLIARRGFRAPPSLHSSRSKALPPGYVFQVITNGYGSMPNYDIQIPVADRWAIIAYLRALQLSRSAALTDLPPAEISKLEAIQ